jgi:predicted metal-binding membrane protein
MHGHVGPAAVASFLGMWVVMMAGMMLPSLLPMLRRYRQAVGGAGATRLASLTALVAVGYFGVWTVVGIAAFPLSAALAMVKMHPPAWAPAVPVLVGVVVLAGGVLQLSAWKARHLAGCRESPGALPSSAVTAWRHGMRLGFHCSASCAGLTASLLAIGVMDLRAMAAVAAAISLERLVPAGWPIPRAIGAVTVGAGMLLIVRAALPM